MSVCEARKKEVEEVMDKIGDEKRAAKEEEHANMEDEGARAFIAVFLIIS